MGRKKAKAKKRAGSEKEMRPAEPMPVIRVDIDQCCPWSRRGRLGDPYRWTPEDRRFATELYAEHLEWWLTRAFPRTDIRIVLNSYGKVETKGFPAGFPGTFHAFYDAIDKVVINLVARNVNALKRSPVFWPVVYVWSKRSAMVHMQSDDSSGQTLCKKEIRISWRVSRVWDLIQQEDSKYKLCQRCALKQSKLRPFYFKED